ncbi:MAG TPA: hypothetical protein VIW29_15115, partial [Polyangiaceae bacterium]
QGALTEFAVAPGVAPFVAARAGLGGHNEAGFAYTGRGIRLDGRHAFEWPSLALSVGAALSGALARPGELPPCDYRIAMPTLCLNEPMDPFAGVRSVELSSLRGYGVELPVVFGYRSEADVVMLWVGARGGVERDTFDYTLITFDTVSASSGDATRFWAGGLLGFAIGLHPIQVRAELDVAYESVSGNLELGDGPVPADVSGVSLTPAMAISAKF